MPGLLQRVKGMPLQPNCCVICGGNPASSDGEQQDAIFAEGVDIDWGNSLYICFECAEIICSLMGRPHREAFEALEAKHEALLEAHAELEQEHEEQEAELERIREGAAAVKRVKAGAK